MRVKRTHTLRAWSMRIGTELWPRLLLNSTVERWFVKNLAPGEHLAHHEQQMRVGVAVQQRPQMVTCHP